MKYDRDPKLRQMYQKREELIKVNRQLLAKIHEKRFYGMTGMTFNEKTFRNMIDFHRPELDKVMGSIDESHEISKLSRNARKILKRNKIINYGFGYYEITPKARNFMCAPIDSRRDG